jgi:H+/Cl- antiporter ClcA
MAIPTNLKQLCTPSYVYFIISVLAIAISAFQNIGNSKKYNLGGFSCNVPSCMLVFVVKIVYIVFWTWILNLMCKDGHTGIAWFLVLLPFVLLFVIISLVMMSQKKKPLREGRTDGPLAPSSVTKTK